jgi:hypothetical protein
MNAGERPADEQETGMSQHIETITVDQISAGDMISLRIDGSNAFVVKSIRDGMKSGIGFRTTEGEYAKFPFGMRVQRIVKVTDAQRAALNLIAEKGAARLDMVTNPALATVHSGTARALQDRGLVKVWSRGAYAEAVLPGSEQDRDVAGIGA